MFRYLCFVLLVSLCGCGVKSPPLPPEHWQLERKDKDLWTTTGTALETSTNTNTNTNTTTASKHETH